LSARCGLIVFDHKGRLVKADAHAEGFLTAMGVELNRSPRLRIEALDTSESGPAGNVKLPGWLDPEWIEPVMEDSERLGTVVVIPGRPGSSALPNSGGLPANKLRHVLEFIQTHIHQAMPLERLAAAVATSPFHFHRQFKGSTGKTPHQYIIEVRMERARALLSESDLPLAEIAMQVGFADQSHFSTAFRRTTSMTPRSYRNATVSA
jgi:AraC-like DNA-binding protein